MGHQEIRMRVPSSDVAKCWLTTGSSALKRAGDDLISRTDSPARPCSSRGGLSKPLETRKISSLNSSVEWILVSVLLGTSGIGLTSQLPGVMASTRLDGTSSPGIRGSTPARWGWNGACFATPATSWLWRYR
jgi:hypothetical protein